MTYPALIHRQNKRKQHGARRYSSVVLQRLLKYHDYLQQLAQEGDRDRIISAELAMFTGCGSSQVRRDLAATGIIAGHPRGYSIRHALTQLRNILGFKYEYPAVLFGAGHLGRLLAQQDWITETNVVLAAIFDIDAAKIGGELNGVPVYSFSSAPSIIEQCGACIATIAVQSEAAQSCADIIVDAGIRAIWNFAPCWLDVPPSVTVRYENLASGLTELLCSISKDAD